VRVHTCCVGITWWDCLRTGVVACVQKLPYYCTKGVRVDTSMLELPSLSIASVVLYYNNEAAGEH
jgi:hypothetical protein